MEREGSMLLVFFICALEGICGVSLGQQCILPVLSILFPYHIGLVLSSLLNTEEGALQISIAIFFPLLLVGGEYVHFIMQV